MRALHLLEPPAPGAAWAPFAGVRPIAELRAGRWRIRERWERALGVRATSIVGNHCAGFREDNEPPCTARPVPGPAIVAASWFAPAAPAGGKPLDLAPDTRRLEHAGTTIGWVVPAGEEFAPSAAFAASREPAPAPAASVDGLLLAGTHSLLDALDRFLGEDCADAADRADSLPPGAVVFGDPAQIRVSAAAIEPGVVFDVRHGAVVVETGAEVRHGARLEGPLWIGPGSRVLGGEIGGSAIGPDCRVRGEIKTSTFLGYANKSHDGFVGDSVVGRWVNLGAGTTTSNLKNTYGPVRLEVAGQLIETARLNVGSFFGDHAKTAIGTMLATGTVVSAGANVFGAAGVPRFVAPFAWGLGGERMTEEGFLRTAERVMARRAVAMTPERRVSLQETYARMVGL
ncbi:MAG TPA: putative sugar nucleotidyl transferase [Gemmatimonadales bacterium]|nr:putative sugar nucleotidyl transferase [Gemmatimonadales bacterium]